MSRKKKRKAGNAKTPIEPPSWASQSELDRLERLWTDSSCETMKAFAEEQNRDYREMLRITKGWVRRREWLRMAEGSAVPKSEEARLKYLGLWWDIVLRLGDLSLDEDGAEPDLKRLSAAASVLKTAQSATGQLLCLEERPQLSTLVIEDLNVDQL